MPSVEGALRTQIRNIEAASGRTMAAWTELIRATGLAKHGEILAWLKTDHGMSHGNANRVALEARAALEGGGGAASDDPIAALYYGKKAALRPIHDRVMAFIGGLGSDIGVAPKKAYVSIRRRKQFAMLQPAAAHVALGLILPDVAPDGRLERSGSFNAMFSHRVRLASVKAVDREVEGWMRAAYDMAE